ncbi:MAG TPA: hypothetical protein VJN18_10095 [Polyangiaceae bacterium]|nr:hypothetical protein [Polyangiaceae bacterium]
MRAIAPVLLLASLGCQAFTDPGIEYVDCFPRGDRTYIEKFDLGEDPPGADRCWRMENLVAPGYYKEDPKKEPEDLVIHPPGGLGARWTETEQAPFFFQRVTGDFLAVTRAETVSGRLEGDHCLNSNEASGMAVRRRAPLAWTTLLVRPALSEAQLMDPDFCADEPMDPPTAQVVAQSHGFGSDEFHAVSGVGSDAEADIALCRKEHLLFYFIQDASVRDPGSAVANVKEGFDPLDVGTGPLDVGLTATAAAGRDTLPEGHFPWLYLKDHSDDPQESCLVMLEEFSYFEED